MPQRSAAEKGRGSATRIDDGPSRKPKARRKRSDYNRPLSGEGSIAGLSVVERDVLLAIEGHGGRYSVTTAAFAGELCMSTRALQEAKRSLKGLGLMGFGCVNDELGATLCVEYRLTEKGTRYLAGECDPFEERSDDER